MSTVCDNLTAALHDLQLQLSPPFPSSLTSMKPANPGSPGKMAIRMERDNGEIYIQYSD